MAPTDEPARSWTPEQSQAISTIGRSVLVSAGAGSGKTAVLSERCAFLVADARPPCRIDQLLVVTFTDAAAAEMRQRIAAALRHRLAADPHDRRLAEQIALVDVASISTLHAFCRRLLGRFFLLVDLDPGFRVLDDRDATLLRRDVLDDLFTELRAGHGDLAAGFDRLIEESGRGGDGVIRDTVDSLDKFLSSIVDPDGWMETQHRLFASTPGGTTPCGDEWVRRRSASLMDALDAFIEGVEDEWGGLNARAIELLGAFAEPLKQILAQARAWRAALERDPTAAGIDRVCDEIRGRSFPVMPRKDARFRQADPAAQAAFERGQEAFRFIREKLFDPLRLEHARFSTAEDAEAIARVAPHVHTIIRLVREFQHRYTLAKRRIASVDFSDLERLTLRLLRDPADPARRTPTAAWLADQFEHVLVDEFQDINPVQDEIIRRVCRSSDDGRVRNLFAVGDVKQSIYRFRLAETGVFLARERAARAAGGVGDLCIDLNRNFRSAAPLLEFVNMLFERLMTEDFGGVRYDDHARLEPGTDAQWNAAGPRVELHLLDDAIPPGESDDHAAAESQGSAADWERIEREAYLIAERIQELGAESGAGFGDMVVLMRSPRRQAPLLVRTLERRGIPVVAELEGGFFDAVEVQDVLAMLALLDNAQQDIPLAAHLRGPLCPTPLTDADLLRIRAWAAKDLPFAGAVAEYARRGPDMDLRGKLHAIDAELARWRCEFQRRPLADALADLLASTGFAACVAARPEPEQRLANLARLHDYARRFSTFTRPGLHPFLRFLEELRDSDEDLGAAPASSGGPDVVRVMSIHRSKGLEFPVVFVCELGKQFNLQDSRGSILFDRELGLGLDAVDVEKRIIYHTLPQRLVARGALRQSLAEELRVLYVALTRAKQRLILVGTRSLADAARAKARRSAANPLPLGRRMAARCYLDWLLPALASVPPERTCWPGQTVGAATLITIDETAADRMRGWKLGLTYEPGVRERLTALARLEECPPALRPLAGDRAAADAALTRLTALYPHASMTRIPAVVAASTLKRGFDAARDDDDPAAPSERTTWRVRLPRPAFLAGVDEDEPTRRGTRTHRFLQFVDLTRECDPAGLRAQAAELAARGVLSAAEADGLDFDALSWFFESPLGRRLRAAGATARREVPFVFAVDPLWHRLIAGVHPPAVAVPDIAQDRILVRGMIDCFFEDGGGVTLLDYKTDAIRPDEVAARSAIYAPQLAVYAGAVEAIWRVRIADRALVFLGPRTIVSTPGSGDRRYDFASGR